MKFLEGTTLEERQRRYYNSFYCAYCNAPSEYVDSIEVHQKSFGMVHLCRPCKAWCGCLPNSDQGYGLLANATLRKLREDAHAVYDKLIASKVSSGSTQRAAQVAGREWISKLLGVDVVEAHIGMMTDTQCKVLIEACKKYIPTPQQIEEKRVTVANRVGLVKALCESIGVVVKEFNVNHLYQLELTHPNVKKTLIYNPKNNQGWWQAKKAVVIPIDDIYVFLYDSFKIEQ